MKKIVALLFVISSLAAQRYHCYARRISHHDYHRQLYDVFGKAIHASSEQDAYMQCREQLLRNNWDLAQDGEPSIEIVSAD